MENWECLISICQTETKETLIITNLTDPTLLKYIQSLPIQQQMWFNDHKIDAHTIIIHKLKDQIAFIYDISLSPEKPKELSFWQKIKNMLDDYL